jgi:hypothetical protein
MALDPGMTLPGLVARAPDVLPLLALATVRAVPLIAASVIAIICVPEVRNLLRRTTPPSGDDSAETSSAGQAATR